MAQKANPMRIVIASLVLVMALLTGLILYMWQTRPEMVVSYGTPFTLTDDLGQPITEKALAGHPSLVYFGFTRCPEVCPTTLYEMAGWFETLGPEAKNVKAFFFSVDPERDSPELMHSYAAAFTDRVTGITGDLAEMTKVAKSWRIYFAKVPTDDGDYTMDHTASVLLLDSKGRFRGTIAYREDAASAIEKIRKLIKEDGT